MANYILRREPEGNQIRLGLKVGGFCKKNITMGGVVRTSKVAVM